MPPKTLEPYQIEGVEWCMTMEKKKKNGFLCDEMGLGKTIQMCALIDKTLKSNPNELPTLICCMLNNVQHWKDEVEGFTGLKPFDPPRKFDGPIPTNVKIVVIPYSIFHRNSPDWVFFTKWARVIYDEGHIASNPKTKLYDVLSNINAKTRWILTATPMQNKQKEIVAMAKGLLKIATSSVKDIIDNHYLRRTHSVEEEALPPLNAIIQVLEFAHPEERMLYDLVQDMCDRRFELDTKNRARLMEGLIRLRQTSIHPSLFFNSVRGLKRKAAGVYGPKKKNGPIEDCGASEVSASQVEEEDGFDGLIDDLDKDLEGIEWSVFEEQLAAIHGLDVVPTPIVEYRKGLESMKGVPVIDAKSLINGIDEVPTIEHLHSTKVEWLINDILENVGKEKIVVFFTFVEELKIVQDNLKSKGVASLQYIGAMAREEKEKALSSFNIADIPVMLMQIKCGGTGINLQVASRVYITCPNYNPCVDMQALGRVYRKGQKKEVTAIRIVMKGTVEERCLAISESKMQGIRVTLGEASTRVFNNELKKEEAAFLISGRS